MKNRFLFLLITVLSITSNSYSFINSKKNIDKLSNPATVLNKTDCKSALIIDPPTISADGDEIYCPQTNVKIAKNVSITHDPSENEITSVNIQISSGYINGQDFLKLSDAFTASNSSITGTFNISEGKLTLKSPTGDLIPYADFVTAIEAVEFYNTSPSPSGIRNFSISIGQGQLSYLPRNGHYYEYVAALGINWTAARDAAASRTYYGLQGYLATLTSADEAQLAGAQAPGTGWIGANDAQTEGTWKWVTGPEGLANGGTGTTFWIGQSNGYATAPDFYANWMIQRGEPNNSTTPTKPNGEDYAHITDPLLGYPGTWNDLSNEGDPVNVPLYYPKGYIVEYGGMPGDPSTLNLSTSTKLTIPKVTSTTPNTRCGSGTVTLEATATDGTISWYDTPTGNTPLATGNSFTTPVISSTTTYFIEAGCTTARSAVTATITPIPVNPASTSPIVYCQDEPSMPLVATASTNCTLKWYTTASGGTASATSPTPSTTAPGSTSYYVSQTNNTTGCESLRTEIIVTVNPLPTAPFAVNISYCQNETAIALTATASANCSLNWYTTATGGTPTNTSPTPSTAVSGTTSYFVSQTENTTGCEGPRAEIVVTINPLPTTPLVNDISYCKNETSTPLTATASANCTLNWYSTATGGTASGTSPMPSTAMVGKTSYFVSQTENTTGCEGSRTEIVVTVNPLPAVNDITIVQCDTDLVSDGKTFFNLTVNNNIISANYTNENFTYYTTLNGADNALATDLIPNELAFENTTPTSMDIWARVSDKTTACYSVAKITLNVPATNISPTYKIIVSPECDDFLDINGNNNSNNDNRDGIATFDLSASKATIQAILPTTDTYSINYYRNEADALAELNVITNLSNYRNIGYPNTQDIWVRVDSNLDNACYGIGPYVTVTVEALPFANTVTIPRQCDDDQDGIFVFDTSSLETTLLNGQTNVTVAYFDQNNNPLKDSNGISINSPFPPNFSTSSQTIKAVVTNNSTLQCFDETTIEFIVDDSPEAFAVPTSLTTACDDESDPLDQDGLFAFDTSTFETTILGGQTGMTVKYFDQNNNQLSSPLPNPFVTGTQNINVTVENPINTNCVATITLPFVVNPTPVIDLNLDGNADELVCSNDPSFFVTLDAGILDNSQTTDYNYIWRKNGIDLGVNQPSLGVNAIGIYSVEVINKNSGCSSIRTITVNASNIATIESIDIVDLADVNSITINVSGPGDYEYGLDDSNNFWQDSNFFDNVPAGIHEVFINDKIGCGIVSREVVVVGIPKYFTPNNDSYNDIWEIKGMIKYPSATIQIFDRYGKHISTLTLSNPSWDGTINGSPLPASDYWYIITLEKDKPTIRGHFTLKR